MRYSLASKARRLFTPSTTKKQPLNGDNPDGGLDLEGKAAGFGFDLKSPGFGSKEDTFFESRPCFESDCEDDFYSVNGEFTPSRGSTPNYQTVATTLNKALLVDKFPDSSSETSPTGRKKLAELFQETKQGELAYDVKTSSPVSVDGTLPTSGAYDVKTPSPKSVIGTFRTSGSNSFSSREVTPSRGPGKKKEKAGKAMNCCLPNLAHNFSFTERRQKASPGRCSV